MLKAKAAIPPNKAAILISGQEGDSVRVSLDVYLSRPEQLLELRNLVGKPLWLLLSDENFELNDEE